MHTGEQLGTDFFPPSLAKKTEKKLSQKKATPGMSQTQTKEKK